MKIAILGAGGRMGRMLVQAVEQNPEAVLVGALEHAGSEHLGADAGTLAGIGALGVAISSDIDAVLEHADCAIDFSLPIAFDANLAACLRHGVSMVIGTTGLSDTQTEALDQAAKQISVVYAQNYSVGVNASLVLLEQAARLFGDTVDIEIIEAHHRHKVDAPSGTAWMMAEAVAKPLGRDLKAVADCSRVGHTGERTRQTIGMQTIRGGDIVGEHTVMFIADGERVEITHKASSRMNFASGAVRAAVWTQDQAAGRFNMQNVLGIS